MIIVISFVNMRSSILRADMSYENPGIGYERVRIGDVGFIRKGQFYRLFSALLGPPIPPRVRGTTIS